MRQNKKINGPRNLGRTKRFIPNTLTILNMFFGFMAIIAAMKGHFELAVWLIFAGLILDGFDGKVARALGTSSEFGIQFDSLADLITFCLAPSIFVYMVWAEPLGLVVGGFFAFMPLMMGAIRLARFNLEAGADQKNRFLGVPTPLMAITVVGLYLFFTQIDQIPFTNWNSREKIGDARTILPLIMIISSLMLSKIPFPKFPALSLKNGAKSIIQLGLALASLILIIWSRGALIFPISMLLIVSGLVVWTHSQRMIVANDELEED